MGVWKLKGCPRCRGDVFLGRDEENRWYEQCLQCGYFNELKDIAAFHEQPREREKKPVLAGKNQQTRRPESRSDIT